MKMFKQRKKKGLFLLLSLLLFTRSLKLKRNIEIDSNRYILLF